MPKDTKTLGNSKARACESLGFVHKKGCARVLTQPLFYNLSSCYLFFCLRRFFLIHLVTSCYIPVVSGYK